MCFTSNHYHTRIFNKKKSKKNVWKWSQNSWSLGSTVLAKARGPHIKANVSFQAYVERIHRSHGSFIHGLMQNWHQSRLAQSAQRTSKSKKCKDNMVEITLILHRCQSKFGVPHIINMVYVVFFRIYGQFPSNRNKKFSKIPCYYRYPGRPLKICQS